MDGWMDGSLKLIFYAELLPLCMWSIIVCVLWTANWNVFLINHFPEKYGILEEAVGRLQKRNGNSSFVCVIPHSQNTFLRSSDSACSKMIVVMCYRYQHPNILELLGCFSDEDHYCLVYPYLPNGSLFHRLHHQVVICMPPYCSCCTSIIKLVSVCDLLF